MKTTDKIPFNITGKISMSLVDANTKKVIEEHSEDNIIVLDARNAIIKAIGNPELESTITSIKLGDDVGTGTQENPQAAQNNYTEATMSVVFDAPYELIVGQLDPLSTTFNVTIVGADVLEQYPEDASKILTSAALHTGDGKVFAYKRFPAKSISALVDLNITWTITIA